MLSPRDEVLVPADGRRQQDVIRHAHAQQVVEVHDERVLRDALPHRQIPGLLPIHISKGGLGPRTCHTAVESQAQPSTHALDGLVAALTTHHQRA